MPKIRVIVFLLTLLVVAVVGTFVAYYARGYRLNLNTLKFEPNGILVIKSEPDGASVYLNGDLKTATNATISLQPGTYDVEVRKDGFTTWSKRLFIEKEVVTQATASLFKNAPSLSPVTFSGAKNPIASNDGTKIAFIVPPGKDVGEDKIGLWTIDSFNLPLGFSNDPRRITDGDLSDAEYIFSPNGRQILLTISESIFLLDSSSFTSQGQRINVAIKKNDILAEWKKEEMATNQSLIKNLPDELIDILNRKTKSFVFSPDENMILYTASGSATLPSDLIKQLPGASTQKQQRNTQLNHTYLYDIKEDRNFLISDTLVTIKSEDIDTSGKTATVRWLPSSRHLMLTNGNEIVIMDYDGTNRQTVYMGSYIAPFAYPYSDASKLLILTNLGGTDAVSNLYSLSIK